MNDVLIAHVASNVCCDGDKRRAMPWRIIGARIGLARPSRLLIHLLLQVAQTHLRFCSMRPTLYSLNVPSRFVMTEVAGPKSLKISTIHFGITSSSVNGPLPQKAQTPAANELVAFRGQEFVRQTLAVRKFCNEGKARPVLLLTFVEAEYLLFDVSLQMPRTWRDVRSLDGALEHRPKAFNGIRVNVPANVLDRVIDNVVNVVLTQTRIRSERVGIDRRAGPNVLANLSLQRGALNARNNPSADLTLALHDPHNDRLTEGWAASALFGLALGVAPRQRRTLRPKKRFVGLDRTRERFIRRMIAHGFANTVKHKPRRLLRNLQCASQFIRRYSVTIARNQPDRGKPLVQTDRRVLKDRPDLGRELLLALAAVPTTVLRKVRDLRVSAAHPGARHAVWPANLDKEVMGNLRVSELLNRLQHRLWNGLLVHIPSIPEWITLVKYIMSRIVDIMSGIQYI